LLSKGRHFKLVCVERVNTCKGNYVFISLFGKGLACTSLWHIEFRNAKNNNTIFYHSPLPSELIGVTRPSQLLA